MKRIILIVGGVTFLIVLIAVWAYLLYFGPPENADDIFAELPFVGNREVDQIEPAPEPEPIEDEEVTPSGAEATPTNPLRQITSEPIAGFRSITETHTGTSTPDTHRVVYVEMGTGHVYEYIPSTNERNRLSNTTIPHTRSALIARDGSFVINQSNDTLHLLDLDSTSTSSDPTTLSIPTDNLTLTEDNHLLYTRTDNNQTIGIARNLTDQTTRTLFSIPVRNIVVSWGSTASAPHLIYNTPSDQLQSYVYRTTQHGIQRLPIAGYGLNLMHSGDQIAYSYLPDPNKPSQRVSMMYQSSSEESTPLVTTILREKCVFLETESDRLICGYEFGTTATLDDWYKGVIQHTDSLWGVNLSDGSGTFGVDLQEESGRVVDVYNLQLESQSAPLYFKNKTDNNLWIYED